MRCSRQSGVSACQPSSQFEQEQVLADCVNVWFLRIQQLYRLLILLCLRHSQVTVLLSAVTCI